MTIAAAAPPATGTALAATIAAAADERARRIAAFRDRVAALHATSRAYRVPTGEGSDGGAAQAGRGTRPMEGQ